MVKRTVEAYDCDICGDPAVRYVIAFPDGSLCLDRCPKHNAKLEKLRTEKGTWAHNGSRSSFKLSSPEDIQRAKKKSPPN